MKERCVTKKRCANTMRSDIDFLARWTDQMMDDLPDSWDLEEWQQSEPRPDMLGCMTPPPLTRLRGMSADVSKCGYHTLLGPDMAIEWMPIFGSTACDMLAKSWRARWGRLLSA